ncbi:hypothetical protein OAL43_03220, partial [bacterium]|nr:hypothetical protein [bacterium]
LPRHSERRPEGRTAVVNPRELPYSRARAIKHSTVNYDNLALIKTSALLIAPTTNLEFGNYDGENSPVVWFFADCERSARLFPK